MLFLKILSCITVATYLAPLLLYKFKKASWHPEVNYIEPFLWLLVISSVYECIFTIIMHVNSDIWFWIYSLLEFLCMLLFFARLFKNKYKFVWLFFLFAFLICFSFFTVLWIISGNAQPDSYLAALETLLVYTGAVLWFKGMFDEMALKSLWDSPAFYFIAGFILYFSGTLFLFLMADFALTREESGKFWIINILLSLFINVILFIGIWKGQQKSIQYSG